MKSSRPIWLQNIVNYLLDNIFDLLTISAAAFVIIRHSFFTPYTIDDFPNLVEALLAILGLIAFSSLWQHHRRLDIIEELGQKTYNLVAKQSGEQIRAEDFFWAKERNITTEELAQAKDIYIVGMILNRAVRSNMALFGDRLAAGANLRFVVLDWENESLMNVMPYRSYGSKPKEWWQNRIKETVGHIEDIPNSDQIPGTLKVGCLPHFPSFGMWLLDPDKPDGKIHIEVYHHRTAEMNPTFSLSASEDAYWYNFFRKQFDLLWESCEQDGRVLSIVPAVAQVP